MRDLCVSGQHEALKASVHGALGTLAAICAIYNVAAWILRDRPGRHLAINAAIYLTVAAIEVKQLRHHLR